MSPRLTGWNHGRKDENWDEGSGTLDQSGLDVFLGIRDRVASVIRDTTCSRI